MYKATIIGHLGADAEVGSSNGKSFVRFRVATSRTYVKGDGTRVDNTQWHSCIMSGDGGALLQYLKKGQLVCVVGENELGIVSSPKLRRMVATSDINVQSIELLGSAPDDMPRSIALPSGELVNVGKAYYIGLTPAIEEQFAQSGQRIVFDAKQRAFSVDTYGFLTIMAGTEPQAQTNEPQSQSNEMQTEQGSGQTEIW